LGVLAFEGPEFQPNVIVMKTVAKMGVPGVDVFENCGAQIQVVMM
jgi:hypothetical protein